MDIIMLSKMSNRELTQAIKNMNEDELEALLTLMEKLNMRKVEVENYLLNL